MAKLLTENYIALGVQWERLNMKITNDQLAQIKSRAIRNFVDLAPKNLTPDQFIAKCWVDACATVLRIIPEYEERQLEAAEE